MLFKKSRETVTDIYPNFKLYIVAIELHPYFDIIIAQLASNKPCWFHFATSIHMIHM